MSRNQQLLARRRRRARRRRYAHEARMRFYFAPVARVFADAFAAHFARSLESEL